MRVAFQVEQAILIRIRVKIEIDQNPRPDLICVNEIVWEGFKMHEVNISVFSDYMINKQSKYYMNNSWIRKNIIAELTRRCRIGDLMIMGGDWNVEFGMVISKLSNGQTYKRSYYTSNVSTDTPLIHDIMNDHNLVVITGVLNFPTPSFGRKGDQSAVDYMAISGSDFNRIRFYGLDPNPKKFIESDQLTIKLKIAIIGSSEIRVEEIMKEKIPRKITT